MDMLYMDTIDGARAAVSEHRYERAMALAAIAQAEIWADIANALRDDEGNNLAHILHNMSYAPATIAAALTDSDARDSLAQTVAIYGS